MDNPKDLYQGREQTKIKHEVLRRYLSVFARVIGSWRDSITYVDGFSGPWNSQSNEFRDSSFFIALEQLRQAREYWRGRGKPVDLRCYFVEQKRSAFVQLDAFCKQQTDVSIRAVHSSFEDALPDILHFATEAPNSFLFTFIDPTGWSGFSMEKIASLLKHKPGEVLVNFMTSHIARWLRHDATREQLESTFGNAAIHDLVAGQSGLDLVDTCVTQYCLSLKKFGNFDFVSPSLILNPRRDEPHFHLIYGSRHIKGLRVFKEAEQGSMEVMEKSRAAVEEQQKRKRGQSSFLDPEEMPESQYYSELRQRYLGIAEEKLKRRLMVSQLSHERSIELVLSHPLVWESDFKSIIDRLLSNDLITKRDIGRSTYYAWRKTD